MKMKALWGAVATTTLALGMLAGGATAASATQDQTVTEWHTWQTTLADGVTDPQSADDVTWPQSHVGGGQIAPPCGVWYQQDKYTGTREAIDAILSDGSLSGNPPEDSGVVVGWAFVYGGECPPEPTVVTPTLTWNPPSCDAPGGLLFDGGALESGVNWVTVGEGGPLTATASPKEGYVFPEGAQTVWNVPDLSQLAADSDECYTPPPGDDLIPVPALFAAQPSIPDCDTDGILPTFDGSQFPNVTFQINPEFTGPGEYVLTVTPNEGYAFDPDNLPAGWGYEPDGGAVSRVLTVNGATGVFQSTEPEAACYRAPTDEPPVDNPPVDNPPVDNPPVVTPATVTPVVVTVTHTATAVPVASKTLAVTGGNDPAPLVWAGIIALLTGVSLMLLRTRKVRG